MRLRMTVKFIEGPAAFPDNTFVLPRVILTDAGRGITTSVSTAVCVDTPEPVARMVIGYEPSGTFKLMSMASDAVAVPLTIDADAGVIVTPDGAPSTASETAPAKPPLRETVTIALPLAVCEMAAGVVPLTLSENAGVGVGFVLVGGSPPPPQANTPSVLATNRQDCTIDRGRGVNTMTSTMRDIFSSRCRLILLDDVTKSEPRQFTVRGLFVRVSHLQNA